ncbi:MAG TPA: CDP-glycerol:glycerophosphate glycerophosphotransferase [Catenuloplanes sp.]|jgi:CDP-glycerol glycerophosphotransferase
MTLLSVVVPVYKVQGYLRQCLDSILGQSFTDVEVIAVDDCSPDGSGRILTEYAAHDPRLRVVSLETNVGLGRARNAGLDHATGEYVWFVDSDDWLAPGALGAVAKRLRATDTDVLLVDWVRSFWNGRVVPGTANKLLPAAPDTFTLADWPAAVEVLHVAWNKVVRRDLLSRLEFRFDEGWYEDVSFTYPVLAAAERISTLDRVCVHYRQRRTGAITRTVGDRHFDVFTHWERAFALVDQYCDAAQALRRVLFNRMLWHYLAVLGNGERVPLASRRGFFKRMTQHYHRFQPTGGKAAPGGVDGLKHRLVARGAFGSFETLRLTKLALKTLKGQARTGLRGAKAVAKGGRDLVYRGFYRVLLLLPRDERLALYSAYWHRGYSCNPAAIYERACDLAPSVRGLWVVNRARAAAMPPGVDYVVTGTLAYYRALARARWLINNVNWPNWVVKRRNSVHVMTHHGTPLKMMGMDQQDHPASTMDHDFAGQMRRADRWDFSVSANAHTTEAWERAYPCRYRTLEVGYPRNDRLARATTEDTAAMRERLGIRPGEVAVLYTPTHREWTSQDELVLDVEDFIDRLGPDHVLLVRAHYFHVKPARGTEVLRQGRVLDVSAYPVVEDLYLAADVMITDYSSAMFDYAVLDRPLVIFAPDWQAYKLLRGVYFDLMAEPPGAVATTYTDLVDLFRTGAYAGDAAGKARAHFRRRFCYLDDGGAAERVVRRVLVDAG